MEQITAVKKQRKSVSVLLKGGVQLILCACLFLLAGALPLYYKNHFVEIGNAKYEFFFRYAGICLSVTGGLFLISLLAEIFLEKRPGWAVRGLKNLSGTDWFALAYLALVLISWSSSAYRAECLDGAKGWHMGLYSQLLFLALYFLFSRGYTWNRIALSVHYLSSAVVFLLELLNRFRIDPLSMYANIDESYQLWFVSTIGQTSWYSSYLCVALPIGVWGYLTCQKSREKFLLAIYCVLGFASLVTQNSDSAFVALACMLAVLTVWAFRKNDNMERFLELVTMILLSFQGVGLLQQLFSEQMVQIGELSLFLSQSNLVLICLLVSLALEGVFWYGREKKGWDVSRYAKGVKILAPVLSGVLLLAVVLLIVLNTKGVLLDWFGWQKTEGFFYFDRWWGNQRGFNWSFSLEVYRSLPLDKRLVGVGPDGFAFYAYQVPELSEKVHSIWGSTKLVNAHNEFLNSLVCYGILGMAAYVGIFISAFVRFCKKAGEFPFVGAAALCILSYIGHNFFCYQQVCCTPFLFMWIGMAEGLLRGNLRWAEP